MGLTNKDGRPDWDDPPWNWGISPTELGGFSPWYTDVEIYRDHLLRKSKEKRRRSPPEKGT